MAGPIDVVIAGTRPFALALFAPVTERAGTRPRIAPEPSTVLTLCAESSGVLVVEYEPRWLPALTSLRRSRPGLRVVAALARGQEDAALELGPLSIEAVPWDGKAISVLPAIERAIGGGPAAAPALAPAPVPEAPAEAAPPSGAASALEERPTLDLFTGLGATAATPSPASLAAVKIPTGLPPPGSGPALELFRDLGAVPVGPAPPTGETSPAPAAPRMTLRSADSAWPANGPSAPEAEQVLRGALAGAADASPLGAVAGRTASDLSALEREAFAGAAMAVDPGLIRRAAVLRLRVVVALATRPPPGTAIDGAAVAELLSEIDGVLGAVKGLLEGAPPEVKVSLEAIRNALVKEAVDFSEACHEIGEVELPATPAPLRGSGRAAGARVLSVHAGVEAGERPEERRRRVVPVIILVVVLALGAGYHAWNYFTAPPRQPPASYEGAPAGTMAVQSGKAYFLKALPGHTVSAAELEAYRQREARRGNQVREVGPGTWIIEPAQPGGGRTP